MTKVSLQSKLGHLIDGEIVCNDSTFPVLSPKTGKEIAQCPQADRELLDRAVAAARRSQAAWAGMGQSARREVLVRMAGALGDSILDVIAISGQEKGSNAAAYEGFVAPHFAHSIAAESLPVDLIEDTDERTVRVVRKPVGVVAAISPWNAPLLISTDKIFTALLVGNTVVVKPSPFTPFGTLALGELWKDIVPPGVLNILAGGDELGEALVAHPDVAMVSFTGSVARAAVSPPGPARTSRGSFWSWEAMTPPLCCPTSTWIPSRRRYSRSRS